jgi:hypothetical protein
MVEQRAVRSCKYQPLVVIRREVLHLLDAARHGPNQPQIYPPQLLTVQQQLILLLTPL